MNRKGDFMYLKNPNALPGEPQYWIGSSEETKPIAAPIRSIFEETNSHIKYIRQDNALVPWREFDPVLDEWDSDEDILALVKKNAADILELQNTGVDLVARAGLAEKASKEEVDVERSRIDNLIAVESTTDNAETADIRVGHDGELYDSAGTAVRKQISDLYLAKVGITPALSEKDIEWEFGYIDASGNKQAHAKYIVTKDFITGLKINASFTTTNYRWALYQYDLSGDYLSQVLTGSTLTEYQLSDQYKYKISYAYDDVITQPSEVSSDFKFYKIIEPLNLQDGSVQLKHLNESLKSQLGASFATKFMHFSIDDAIAVFKDITTNASTYTSIFNNATLNYFKQLHDIYNVVVSFYCFYSDGAGFDLSQATNQFASEFTSNADWLKFGVHGDFTSAAAPTGAAAKSQYEAIVTQIHRITGNWECIDRVPRLGSFAGSYDNIKALTNAKASILGLLTADDTRISYYLTQDQNDYMLTHDRLYDSDMRITLFSSDFRVESVDVTSKLNTIKTSIDYVGRANDLIIFTHEYELVNQTIKERLEICCQFAQNNGYVFDFPMNKILG